ncbi:MAG: hypothetical protein LBR11_02310 [Deltaproteobacteria bacterium]|nr:hypothetical protein [Deltaproteobacteria bacterium]
MISYNTEVGETGEARPTVIKVAADSPAPRSSSLMVKPNLPTTPTVLLLSSSCQI